MNKDELIKEVANSLDALFHNKHSFEEMAEQIIDFVQQNTNEWVSAEDRLPTEIGLKYPVSNGDFIDYDIFDGEEFVEFGSQVEFWMERPTPPKSE